MEQALGRGHAHEGGHLAAAAGLAENQHVVRVAAELGNVVMDPLQGHGQVQHAAVGAVGILLAEGGEVEEADDVQAMVDSHDDHIAKLAEVLAVIGNRLDGGAVGEAAAMEEDDDRLLASSSRDCVQMFRFWQWSFWIQ